MDGVNEMRCKDIIAGLQHGPQKCANVIVNGRRTTLRIEPYYWDSLRDIGRRESFSVNELCSLIDNNLGKWRKYYGISGAAANLGESFADPGADPGAKRPGAITLTTAIRVFTIAYYRWLAQGTVPPYDRHGNIDPDPGSSAGH